MSHVDDGMLHAYLDGELSQPEAQGVEAHVAKCPVCRERLEEERALIARATELLARAAPPDRELPPFRPGDLKPPLRLWWHVRLPVAWAATIALALGIGIYVGERGVKPEGMSPERARDMAGRLAQNAPAPALDSHVVAGRQRLAEPRLRAARPLAPPVPPAAARAAAEKWKGERLPNPSADSVAIPQSGALAVRESTPVAVDGQHLAAKAVAPSPARAEWMRRDERGYAMAMKDGLIGVDSARALLGREPVALPDVPIRAIYRGRMLGYSAVVIIVQALDSSTVIEVINGRPAPLQLEAVVAGAAAARPDSQRPGARALGNARVVDSLGAASRPAPAPAAKMAKAERAASDLFVDVRGPLSADSLATLHRLVRPLRP